MPFLSIKWHAFLNLRGSITMSLPTCNPENMEISFFSLTIPSDEVH
jgi:hypothetical protein